MIDSRKLVYKTLEFDNKIRVPRHLWTLPWAYMNHASKLAKIQKDFPDDITTTEGFYLKKPVTYGDQYETGEYIDEWGCKFVSVQRGMIGEVKEPLIKDENWGDIDKLVIPKEVLMINKNRINEFCKNTDKFVISDFARPFERIQFLRGTQQLYIDLMLRPDGFTKALSILHDFYCQLMEEWAKTDVDALFFMDDWGAQQSLLIDPVIWTEVFKPLYKDYITIAHTHGKKIFMHSDGYILDIIPHLIELGLDAINCQIFCMGFENLKQFAGKITFWGEIDRQHLLPYGTRDDIYSTVKNVKESLCRDGGCIAQCEFGAGASPDNVYSVFEAWAAMD